jgi:hypothetical protein
MAAYVGVIATPENSDVATALKARLVHADELRDSACLLGGRRALTRNKN